MSWAINFPCPSDEHTHYPDQSKVIKHQKFWPLPAMLGGVCGIWVSFGRGPVKPLTNRATWLWGWPKEYIGAFKCHQRGTCKRALETMKATYIYSSDRSQTDLKTIDVHIREVLMTGIFGLVLLALRFLRKNLGKRLRGIILVYLRPKWQSWAGAEVDAVREGVLAIINISTLVKKYQYWWLGLGSSWKCHCD